MNAFRLFFEILDRLLSIEDKPGKKIGFTVKEEAAQYRQEA